MDHSGEQNNNRLRPGSLSLNLHEPSSDQSFTAQLLEGNHFGAGSNFIQGYGYSTEQGPIQNTINQQAEEHFDNQPAQAGYLHQTSSYSTHQGFTDFPLYGPPESPEQNINTAFFNDSDPSSDNVNPALLSHPTSHHQTTVPLSPEILDTGESSSTYLQPFDYITWEQALYQTVRSAPSDRSSAAASPLFANEDFSGHNSPLLSPDEPVQELFLEAFKLESAHHSPLSSPRVSPVADHLSLQNSPHLPPADFALANQEAMQFNPYSDLSLSASRRPPIPAIGPIIAIEFAPPQRQPTNPNVLVGDEDALQLPVRGPRRRSHSDPFIGSGKGEAESIMPRSSPAIGGNPGSPRSNSPRPNSSRSNSSCDITAPVGSPNSPLNKTKISRRVSAPPVPDREKVIVLANPSSTDSKRVQKHPATFQCGLCPKRFTRAYNLRSHLRTHTDERPFVCTVCGKAFARQHDKKRHEALHSGEKKYVCKGELKGGVVWGCERRFARADALGRHFRSEAGRICIRPLLDEEKADKRQAEVMMMQMGVTPQMTAMDGTMGGDIQDVTAGMVDLPMGDGTYFVPGSEPLILPAALLAQYPALAKMNWDAGPGIDGGGGIDDDPNGQSYDISGGEWDEEVSDAHSSHRNSYDGCERDWPSDVEVKQGWTSDVEVKQEWR